jgi:hypothetical protein
MGEPEHDVYVTFGDPSNRGAVSCGKTCVRSEEIETVMR